MKPRMDRIRNMMKLITPGLSGEWAKSPKRPPKKQVRELNELEQQARVRMVVEGLAELKKLAEDEKTRREISELQERVEKEGWKALSEENRRTLFRIKEIESRIEYSAEHLPKEVVRRGEKEGYGVGVSDVGGIAATDTSGSDVRLTGRERKELRRLLKEGKKRAILIRPTGSLYAYQGPDGRILFRRASAQEVARHEETHLKYVVDDPAFKEAFAYLETYPSEVLESHTKMSEVPGPEPHTTGWEIARKCARIGITAGELYTAYNRLGAEEVRSRLKRAAREKDKKKARKLVLGNS